MKKIIEILLLIFLVQSCEKDETETINDADGNVYKTVTIGDQVWMAENLKTTKYRNGDLIGTTTPDTLDISNETSPKYEWAVDGNESNLSTYGRLYTWYVAADSRKLCPDSWHIPTNAEWATLINFLGGEDFAGGRLKAGPKYWAPNDAGYYTSSKPRSGFNAQPASYRNFDGTFVILGFFANFWSLDSVNSTKAWNYNMSYESFGIWKYYADKKVGSSVRCLKN